MDRSRLPVLVAAVISVAAALFALGAALTSDEDDPVAAPTTAATAATASAASETTASGADGTSAGSGPESSAASAGATFDIEIAGFEFGPADAVVQVGATVTWTNNDGFEHTIVSDTGAFDPSPELGDGDTYSFTFTEAGTYAYKCGVHPQMRGTVVVEG